MKTLLKIKGKKINIIKEGYKNKLCEKMSILDKLNLIIKYSIASKEKSNV